MIEKYKFHDELHDTWTVLAHTYRLIGRLWNKELNEYGFSREQALNLLIIKCLGDDATPYRISRFQAQEHNTVSDILNRMKKQGLVTKLRESQGRSRVKVKLTERGEKALAQSRKRDSLIRIMSALSADELKQLRSSLEKLRDAVLKEFEKDQEWPEIRILPSQWSSPDLLKRPAGHKLNKDSKAKAANLKGRNKRRLKESRS